MNNVYIDYKGLSQPVFIRQEKDGSKIFYDYKLPVHTDIELVNESDYEVELLINPILNRGNDIFFVKNTDTNDTAGLIFPVATLDDDPVFTKDWQYDFIYIAYKVLFGRFDAIPASATRSITQCFKEQNICVSVLNKSKCKTPHPLSSCIQYLRRFGYHYFEPDNKYRVPDYYDRANLDIRSKYISVRFVEPVICRNRVIDSLMRELPFTHDLTHRFVILYQVIELLMEHIGSIAIRDQINLLNSGCIPNNDFLDNINNNSRERSKIKNIFSECNITVADFSQFRSACERLYSIIGYNPYKPEVDANLFYSFRNQMTHNYRNLYQHAQELAETIQAFEILTLLIVIRYQHSI